MRHRAPQHPAWVRISARGRGHRGSAGQGIWAGEGAPPHPTITGEKSSSSCSLVLHFTMVKWYWIPVYNRFSQLVPQLFVCLVVAGAGACGGAGGAAAALPPVARPATARSGRRVPTGTGRRTESSRRKPIRGANVPELSTGGRAAAGSQGEGEGTHTHTERERERGRERESTGGGRGQRERERAQGQRGRAQGQRGRAQEQSSRTAERTEAGAQGRAGEEHRGERSTGTGEGGRTEASGVDAVGRQPRRQPAQPVALACARRRRRRHEEASEGAPHLAAWVCILP
eukprot:SAG11_NODE_3554_length_2375_cov_3.807118_3_plen_286_part_00